MFHGNGAEPDTDDEEEFNGMRYYVASKEKKKHRRAFDHCNYTGKYRGAEHSICNLT